MMTQPTKPIAGNPASTQPMPGISARGLKLLSHRRPGFCTLIPPAGDGLAQQHKRKARI